MYFGFANIYSAKILNYYSFQEQFHSGIYQYRILGGYFLIWIYDFLSTLNIDYDIFKLKLVNPDSEPKMYVSFYILNTGFLMLSGAITTLITESKIFLASYSEKLLITAVAIFAMALSQFVIVPYDVSSYFFLLLFFYLLIQYLQNPSILIAIFLGILIIVSTLNRESSALSLSLAATLLYSKLGMKKEMILPILGLGILFMVTYFGLRLINESFTTNDGNLLVQNISQPKNILGILFSLVFFTFTLILAKDNKAIKKIILFHLFSLPYLLLCFYTGILYEIRLYIPLFLTSLLLSKTELSTIH